MWLLSPPTYLLNMLHLLYVEFKQVLKLLTPGGIRQFSQDCKDFKKLLHAFYVEGGLTIVTREWPTAPGDATPAFRTVIQPDGDILSFLTRKYFKQPEYWEKHRAAIREELDNFKSGISRILTTINGLASIISILISVLLFYLKLHHSSALGIRIGPWLYPLALSATIAIFRMIFPRIGLFLIRRKLPISL